MKVQTQLDTKELLKKVRKVEIKTKHLTQQIFSGNYHSAFKGKGMTFSEVRDYKIGDEIRMIDWNVTARMRDPHIKVFEEERELSVFFLVDISNSTLFGSNGNVKRALMTELIATLAISATGNNDKIGALFFSNEVDQFIPAKKGRSHALRIIRDSIEMNSDASHTSLNSALKRLNNVAKKKAVVFIISDFISDDYQDQLKYCASKHDVMAIRVHDPLENELPAMGIAPVYDLESQSFKIINTSSKKKRLAYQLKRNTQLRDLEAWMKKNGVDYTQIQSDENFIMPLIKLFKYRKK